VRSGCLSLMVRVGAVAAAAMLAALSAALILSFGVSALGQPEGLERIFKVIVAAAAGFAFFLVGRGIWRDLRRRSSKSEEGSSKGSRR
jgi:hypothetical protein